MSGDGLWLSRARKWKVLGGGAREGGVRGKGGGVGTGYESPLQRFGGEGEKVAGGETLLCRVRWGGGSWAGWREVG